MTLRLAWLLAPGPKTVAHARLAESLGCARGWLADSPALWQHVWTRMAQVAEDTQRLQLGTAVLIPSLRHVVTQAAAIATIADIAPGRLTVGCATGFTGRHALGHKQRLPWAYVKRYVQQRRGLLHGDTVEVDGALCRLVPSAGYMPPFPIAVPIFLAVQGLRGRQVAKDVADGVIMPSRFVTGGFDPCVVTASGTVLDEAEDLDSPHVRAAAAPGVARVYHTAYEARDAAVDALPNGRAWRESLERIPEETRHLALRCGHGIEMNAHDRAHVPMTDAKRLSFTGKPGELRAPRRSRGAWRHRNRLRQRRPGYAAGVACLCRPDAGTIAPQPRGSMVLVYGAMVQKSDVPRTLAIASRPTIPANLVSGRARWATIGATG